MESKHASRQAWEASLGIVAFLIAAATIWYTFAHNKPQALFLGLFLGVVVLTVAFAPRLVQMARRGRS